MKARKPLKARKLLAALAAIAFGTVSVPATAQSFIADLVAAPFYIAGGALAAAQGIVAAPFYYSGYGYYGYPSYGSPLPYPYPPAYVPPVYAPPPPQFYGPATYYYRPMCGYDPWGRWACPVR
jgi:hypothetical protein